MSGNTKDPFFKSYDSSNKSLKRKRPSRQKKSTTSTKLNKNSNKIRNQSHLEDSHHRGLKKGKERHRLDEEIETGSVDNNEDDQDDGLSATGMDEDIDTDDDQEFKNETPAEKRLRLAKMYVEGLEKDQMLEEGAYDAAEIDREIIESRLQKDVLESHGKLHMFIGTRLTANLSSDPVRCDVFRTGRKQHRLPVTCVKLNKTGTNLYVADKQGRIIRYDCSAIWDELGQISETPEPRSGLIRPTRVMLNHVGQKRTGSEKFETKKRSKEHKTLSTAGVDDQKGHLGEVLTIDVTEDEKILASGGKDKLIGVWDLEDEGNSQWKVGLRGHKDLIASISFRSGTSTLYTASFDRMIKVFDLASLTYSETLFGHQDRIQSISSLRNEVLVSAGGRDRTCRYWKIIDESQLVFRGGGNSRMRDLIDGVGFDPDEGNEWDEADGKKGKRRQTKNSSSQKDGVDPIQFIEGSIDCVCMIDDKLFLSGGDTGSISLWTTSKKKAVFTYPLAHGTESVSVSGTGGKEVVNQARWITSLYCLPYGDTFVSGSWDGLIKIWRLTLAETGGGRQQHMAKFELLGQVSIGPPGQVVNSIHAIVRKTPAGTRRGSGDQDQLAIAVGIGQEHRLGRWTRLSKARNECVVVSVGF